MTTAIEYAAEVHEHMRECDSSLPPHAEDTCADVQAFVWDEIAEWFTGGRVP